jgi:hypothetical protein
MYMVFELALLRYYRHDINYLDNKVKVSSFRHRL